MLVRRPLISMLISLSITGSIVLTVGLFASHPAPAPPRPPVPISRAPVGIPTVEAGLVAAVVAEAHRAAEEQAAQDAATRERLEMWYRLGRCEQPGHGEGGVDWTAHDDRYQGGLGFWYGTWDQWRRGEFAEEAWQAPPADQIIVAERVLADVGPSAWGCANAAGLQR